MKRGDALREAVLELRNSQVEQVTGPIYRDIETECPGLVDVLVEMLCMSVNESRAVQPEQLGILARQQFAQAIWIGRRAKEIEFESSPHSMKRAIRAAR